MIDNSVPENGMELVCPAGTLSALKMAVDAGAHTVYCGFQDETNARNYPGLNFTREEMAEGIGYAHDRGGKVFIPINTCPSAGKNGIWHRAVDDAARLGADAVILADIGMCAYAKENHPQLRRHLSVQASASTEVAINAYVEAFGIARVVLPRILTFDEIKSISDATDVEIETFVFGGMGIMAEGRCIFSTYATGVSPNIHGACSPASHVRYVERDEGMALMLGDNLINISDDDEAAAYPTVCKGRYRLEDGHPFTFEDPCSLNMADNLATLYDCGVRSLKIEGRQRGKAYVAEVVRQFRAAVDALRSTGYGQSTGQASQSGSQSLSQELMNMTEGRRTSGGGFDRKWH